MADEFNSSSLLDQDEFNTSPQEYGPMSTEYYPIGSEYPSTGQEEKTPHMEYSTDEQSVPIPKTKQDERTKHFSRIRRAGYLAAAAVATVLVVENVDIPPKTNPVRPLQQDIADNTDIDDSSDDSGNNTPGNPDDSGPVDIADSYDYSGLKPYMDDLYALIVQDYYVDVVKYVQTNESGLLEALAELPSSSNLVYTSDGVYELEDDSTDYLMRVTYQVNNSTEKDITGLWFKFFTADSFANAQYPNSRIVYCDTYEIQAMRGDFTGLDSANVKYEDFCLSKNGTVQPFYNMTGTVSNGHFTGSATVFTYGNDFLTLSADQHKLDDVPNVGVRYYELDSLGRLNLEQISYLSSKDGYFSFDVFMNTDYRYFVDYNQNNSFVCVREYSDSLGANYISYATHYLENPDSNVTLEIWQIQTFLKILQ